MSEPEEKTWQRTKGELLGYHCKEKKAKLETADGNTNYLCVSNGTLNMAAEIANLRGSPFMKEVKHLNALHIMKCWNMHNEFVSFMSQIMTNDEPNPTKALVSLSRKARKLWTQATKE